ncbi:hypothetical protein LEP1GSC170_0528 [Leptospira interrogans serovar Bataviae str. HAI135]|nr:hypothetical protein LEP1GSC170_0528 [Leptospira interrogans serovar Bataviae str. HAI135]
MNELKHNAFLNSASNSPNSAKRFLRKRFRSFEVTQRLASTVARGNSASRFYGRSRKLSVSLPNSAKRFLRKRFRSFEETQRLAPQLSKTLFTKAF